MAPPDFTAASPAMSSAKSAASSALPNRGAYATFLAGKGDYIKGVVVLAKGLRKVKSQYPLVVAVLPDVPEEHRRILASQGCLVREIEPVQPPHNQSRLFAREYYIINYSKLRFWEFVEYRKIVYLDGDVQVYDNIDHLFDLPDGHFYAVKDCLCDGLLPLWQQCPERLPWPTEELGPRPRHYFNAGVFLFEPNLSTYYHLLDTLKVTPPTAFAEQDFLNMFFKDIYEPIPAEYNFLLAMLWRHPDQVDLDKVKVVHYCAPGSKPWRFTGEEEHMDREDIKMLVQKWWDIYNEDDSSVTLDNMGPNSAAAPLPPPPVEDEADRAEGVGNITVLSEAGVVYYIAAPSAA